MSILFQGTKVWIPNMEHVWISAVVTHPLLNEVLLVEVDKGQLVDNRQSVVIEVKNESEFPPLCNPEILVSVSDLTYLSFLHEPAVLHNLKIRFLDLSTIYTYCGETL